MSGTSIGARKATQRILRRDPDHFKRIGQIGGRNGTTGGFADNHERASVAGAKGGKLSKKGHKYLRTEDGYRYYTKLSSGRIVKYEI